MVEHRRSDRVAVGKRAAGHVLTSLKRTSIPGSDDANAIGRGFAQRAFIGTRCHMNPWSDVFLIPTWAGAIPDGRTSKKRPNDDWKTHAAGQVLTSLQQTSIPGNDNANAIRKQNA